MSTAKYVRLLPNSPLPGRLGQGSGFREIKWSVVKTTKNALLLRVEGVTDIAQLCGCTDLASHSCACPHFRFGSHGECEDCQEGWPGKHFATCPFYEEDEPRTTSPTVEPVPTVDPAGAGTMEAAGIEPAFTTDRKRFRKRPDRRKK